MRLPYSLSLLLAAAQIVLISCANEKPGHLKSEVPEGTGIYKKIAERIELKERQKINQSDAKNKKQGFWVEFRTDTIRFETPASEKGTYKTKTSQNKDTLVTLEWKFPTPHYTDNTIFLDPGGTAPYDFQIVNDSMRIKYTITEYGNYKNDLREGVWTNKRNCELQKITYARGEMNGEFKQYSYDGKIKYKGLIDPRKKEQAIKGYNENGKQDTVVTSIPYCIPVYY